MKKAIKESASMNVSMTADNASEVADLMKLLKNAGMDDAKPVGDIMSRQCPMLNGTINAIRQYVRLC